MGQIKIQVEYPWKPGHRNSECTMSKKVWKPIAVPLPVQASAPTGKDSVAAVGKPCKEAAEMEPCKEAVDVEPPIVQQVSHVQCKRKESGEQVQRTLSPVVLETVNAGFSQQNNNVSAVSDQKTSSPMTSKEGQSDRGSSTNHISKYSPTLSNKFPALPEQPVDTHSNASHYSVRNRKETAKAIESKLHAQKKKGYHDGGGTNSQT